jgi:hypothetical protein
MRPRNRSQSLVLVAVMGAHALVIGVLLGRPRWPSPPSPSVIPISAFILTYPMRPRPPMARPRLNATSATPITEAITLSPPVLPVTGPSGPAIDWGAQAKRSVARVLEPSKHISFGFPVPGDSGIKLGNDPPPPLHYAGESDRLEGGEQIYWLNDHCYIVSEPPSLFVPEVLQNARLSTTMCK